MPYAIIRVTDKGTHLSSHYKNKICRFSIFKTTEEADAYGKEVYGDDKRWITVEVTEKQLRRLMNIKNPLFGPCSFLHTIGINDAIRGIKSYITTDPVITVAVDGRKYVAVEHHPTTEKRREAHDKHTEPIVPVIPWYLDPTTPNTARVQGKAACLFSHPASDNPYQPGRAAFEWLTGWCERDLERRGL